MEYCQRYVHYEPVALFYLTFSPYTCSCVDISDTVSCIYYAYSSISSSLQDCLNHSYRSNCSEDVHAVSY